MVRMPQVPVLSSPPHVSSCQEPLLDCGSTGAAAW
jgi:hypothetical protein